MKAYITQFATTNDGKIDMIESELYDGKFVREPKWGFPYEIGVNAFLDEESALADAEKRRPKEIKRLSRKIDRLSKKIVIRSNMISELTEMRFTIVDKTK